LALQRCAVEAPQVPGEALMQNINPYAAWTVFAVGLLLLAGLSLI
jgi:hypothetical protein